MQSPAHVDTAFQLDAVALDARAVGGQFAAHQCDDRRPTQLRTGRRRAPVTVDDVIADAAQPLVVFQSSTKQHISSVSARPSWWCFVFYYFFHCFPLCVPSLLFCSFSLFFHSFYHYYGYHHTMYDYDLIRPL